MRIKRFPSAQNATSPRGVSAKGGALSRCAALWIADGQAAGWSPNTLGARRDMLRKFGWWLGEQKLSDNLADIDAGTIRLFLAHLRDTSGARWGEASPNTQKAARPSTVDTYYRCLRAFFNFTIREGLIFDSPIAKVSPTRIPKDQIKPFTPEQAQSLVDAAKKSQHPERDTALVLVLLDTGLRVSELVSLTVGDIDPDTKELTVIGKGNKTRSVYLSPSVRRALWRYAANERRLASEDEPLFVASRGRRTDAGLTTSGVGQLFRRLGSAAGLRNVRCSPHTARHYYALSMLRNGANLFELQRLMGHEDLTMLRRYVALAESDLAQVHRRASPAARLKV
ncbi:MAG: tyrosine-type recombinase/integrase [Actinomycetota bacterium]